MVQPLEGTASGKSNGIARVRYNHDALIDLMLAHPEFRQGQFAAYFGMTEGWISRVIGSDAFQLRLAQRKEELINPDIKATMEERIQGLALTSLAQIQEKIDAKVVPFDGLVKTLELTTKALGMGARQANIQQQNNYVVALPPKVENELDWAAQAARNAQELAAKSKAAREAIDVEAKTLPAE